MQFQHCWHNLIEIKAPKDLGKSYSFGLWGLLFPVASTSCPWHCSVICPGKVHCFRLLEVWGCPEQPQGLVIPDHPEISRTRWRRSQRSGRYPYISLWYDIPMMFLWYSYDIPILLGLGLHAMLCGGKMLTVAEWANGPQWPPGNVSTAKAHAAHLNMGIFRTVALCTGAFQVPQSEGSVTGRRCRSQQSMSNVNPGLINP